MDLKELADAQIRRIRSALKTGEGIETEILLYKDNAIFQQSFGRFERSDSVIPRCTNLIMEQKPEMYSFCGVGFFVPRTEEEVARMKELTEDQILNSAILGIVQIARRRDGLCIQRSYTIDPINKTIDEMVGVEKIDSRLPETW